MGMRVDGEGEREAFTCCQEQFNCRCSVLVFLVVDYIVVFFFCASLLVWLVCFALTCTAL